MVKITCGEKSHFFDPSCLTIFVSLLYKTKIKLEQDIENIKDPDQKRILIIICKEYDVILEKLKDFNL